MEPSRPDHLTGDVFVPLLEGPSRERGTRVGGFELSRERRWGCVDRVGSVGVVGICQDDLGGEVIGSIGRRRKVEMTVREEVVGWNWKSLGVDQSDGGQNLRS